MQHPSGPSHHRAKTPAIPSTPGRPSRRQFLAASATGAIAAGWLGNVGYASELQPLPSSRGDMSKAPLGLDPALFNLIQRTTMGFNRSTYDEAANLGYEAFVEQQLDYESIDDSGLDARLATYPTLNMTSQEIYNNYATDQSVPRIELWSATLLRAVYSERQLFERMVTFWTDHFNSDIQDNLVLFLKTADDRDVIRKHAMSSFPELLTASAHSGAMLYYLDNYANIVGHAQENYARELMELHSLGVDNGYNQEDVEEVARCLTGWTLHGNDGRLGDFLFRPGDHDNLSKRVLGQFIPAFGGESDGDTVLEILYTHPNTAGFIAKKLCAWFLGYDPPEDIVQSVKATYLATGGDIREMLRVILHQNVITYMTTPKVKRPLHLVASTLRATDAEIDDPYATLVQLFLMGHLPFYWSAPDGYPDSAEDWGTSVLPRWRYTADVFFNNVEGISIDTLGLLASEGAEPSEWADAINRILSGGAMSHEEVAIIQQMSDEISYLSDQRNADNTFGLAASIPSYQWY